MKRLPVWFCGFVFSVALVLATLCGCVYFMGTNLDYYTARFEKLDVPVSSGAGIADLREASRALIDYLDGRSDSLDALITVDGQKQQAFGQDERDHMVDVLGLFVVVKRVLWICALLSAVLLTGFIAMGADLKRAMFRGARAGYFAILALSGALALLALTMFDTIFVKFHQLLFSNELWMMDPATQFMIRMFPQEFFQQIALIALGATILLPAALLAIAWRAVGRGEEAD